MAKHPVPKKKQSKARSRDRYAQYARTIRNTLLDGLQLTNCPKCGSVCRIHNACGKCGAYRDRSIRGTKKTPTVTKIKV